MIAAIFSLTALGLFLGLVLGVADRIFKVETNPVVDEILAMMPGSNCGQCGFAGCAGAANALADGKAAASVCPPGGKELAVSLVAKLGISLDMSQVKDDGPQIAFVSEDICIGCCRCIKACPTDAIIGAAKQIHAVIREACTGCSSCVDRCPTEAMTMKPVPVTVQHWVWPKPAVAA
ncbi:MAG TPA: RnfABCDGE type electron transport complex subunit B [Rhodocyclaceae bacterium]|jgi:electron transport complex protein RnfB